MIRVPPPAAMPILVLTPLKPEVYTRLKAVMVGLEHCLARTRMSQFAPTLFRQRMAMMAESCCSWRTYDRSRSNIDVPLPYCGDGGGVHIGVVALLSTDSYDPVRSDIDAQQVCLFRLLMRKQLI